MGNLKIRVNSEVENKEVQGAFKILGGSWSKHVNADHYDKEFLYLTNGVIEYDDLLSEFLSVDECKEITLPELRDLVVLKRNDVGDATHIDQYRGKWFCANGVWYFYTGKNKWDESLSGLMNHYDLKPITKEEGMKEYLNKETYTYVKTHDLVSKDSNWIEIPEGAEIYIDLGFRNHSFYKDNFKLCWCGVRWENTVHNSMNLERWNNTPVLWKRHTHPEELPFIDDEPSLNDQYAEIETVRQSAWQKQEGGSHYKNLKIQPMQYALENKLDYAQANVVKYVTRHKEKNGKEDLLKAIHNLELMIEFYYGDEK